MLWPLSRRGSGPRSGSDVAVYRDQLDEIERDRAAGLIKDEEAAGAGDLEGEKREQRALLGPAERDGPIAVVVDLERAEEPDLHGVMADSSTARPASSGAAAASSSHVAIRPP